MDNKTNKILHHAAITEIDVCDDLMGLIYDSNSTPEQKAKMLEKIADLRKIISSLTMRVDWCEDGQ